MARIICGTVFSHLALNIGRNFTLRYYPRRGFCARLKFVPRTSLVALFYSHLAALAASGSFVDIASRYAKQENGYFAAFLSVSAAMNRAINSSKLCAMSRASS